MSCKWLEQAAATVVAAFYRWCCESQQRVEEYADEMRD